ncbi:hypothetical protein TMatcc_004671 [Talaromyces marneffei ATCC 18224]|uniref:Extracellular serine-threonine rich protein n=2 Tax=Talaromyces marneffei TaxID=37727 RepID=B6Q3E3_TALMQ|nr:uncharacterized protein EYB26_000399 [Talaromyces marneffei]EEA27049.1 extracellular serine-threonine rich protein [Talaromyces marneffei ATCC 18224]KAE8557228.1 hypothetical protein EYB25_001934 [Talaromyces marneffei]QGA12754.1 hypothetical protein EYB26_000399 [Talaromyces marneffei]
MKFSSVSAVAAFLAVQQVSAFWDTESCFPSPSNCDNKCTDTQKNGWEWSWLNPGQTLQNFDGFGFSGFTCSERSGGKGKRTSDKCISGSISKSKPGKAPAPSISCGADIDAFSITHFSVFTEKDTDVNFHFGMPDGSKCSFTTKCGSEGTDVPNKQCGGATSVSWTIPDHSDVDDCGFGIYSIGFDCNPGTGSPKPPPKPPATLPPKPPATLPPKPPATLPPKPPATVPVSVPVLSVPTAPVSVPVSVPGKPTEAAPTSAPATSPAGTSPAGTPPAGTPPAETVPAETVPASAPGTSPAPATPAVPTSAVPGTPVVGQSSPAVSSVGAVSTAPVQSFSTSTVFTTTEVTITSCAPTVTNCPAESKTVVTQTIAISTTICPVTATETGVPGVPGAASTAPAPAPEGAASSTSPAGTSPTSSPAPGPQDSCPSVVPKCINTWLPDTCADNTDVSCYCPSSNATAAIISCIQAWSADSSEVSTALSYFTGICSGFIPGNPGIVTAVPSTITLAPTPAPSGTAAATSVPCTTITFSSSTYTVPQVAFTTASPTGVGATPTVGLIGVTSIPANTNPVAAVTTLATKTSAVPGVAGATGVKTPTASSTLKPFTGAAVPGAIVSRQGMLLTGVMGMLALFL